MHAYINKIINQKDHGIIRRSNPTSIQNIKSVGSPKNYQQKLDQRRKTKVQSKELGENDLIQGLRLSKSNPKPLTLGNNYIKLDINNNRNYQQFITKLHTSMPKENKQYHPNLDQRNRQSKKKEPTTTQKLITESTSKKPKFIRRKNSIKEESLHSPPGSCNSFMNLNDSFKSMEDLLYENLALKKKLLNYEVKIQEFDNKLFPNFYKEKIKSFESIIKEYQAKLAAKDKEIQELKNMAIASQEEKNMVVRKLEDIMSDQQPFKGSLCSLNLDDSAIGADMLSTAEYIESLTDLQEELHQRKTEIFDLNKTMEQLKMKHHFAELRNEQNVRILNLQWENKYRKLLNMYKALKASASRNDNNKMKKLKTRTQYIDYQKQELFNLSISTEKSQLQLH